MIRSFEGNDLKLVNSESGISFMSSKRAEEQGLLISDKTIMSDDVYIEFA